MDDILPYDVLELVMKNLSLCELCKAAPTSRTVLCVTNAVASGLKRFRVGSILHYRHRICVGRIHHIVRGTVRVLRMMPKTIEYELTERKKGYMQGYLSSAWTRPVVMRARLKKHNVEQRFITKGRYFRLFITASDPKWRHAQ